MDQILPAQALKSLREGYKQINDLGAILVEKKKAYIVIEARLIDAEHSARQEYFLNKPCKISEMRDWLKMTTWSEFATEAQARSEIKAIETELDIIIECLNAIKAASKISQVEIQNLNYQHD